MAKLLSILNRGLIGYADGFLASQRKPIYGFTAVFDKYSALNGLTALNDSRIPQPASQSTDFPGLYVCSRSAKQTQKSQLNWDIEVTFGYDPSFTSVNQQPWLRKTKADWTSASHTVYQDHDLTTPSSLNFTNSAGDRYDQPPPITLHNPVLLLSKARLATEWTPYTFALLVGTMPSSGITISTQQGDISISAYDAVLRDIKQTTRVWNDGTLYYDIEMQIEIYVNYPVGYVKVLDNGYHQLVGGVKSRIKNDDGTFSASPSLLNGAGAKLANGGTPVFFPASGFQVASAADWTGLNG